MALPSFNPFQTTMQWVTSCFLVILLISATEAEECLKTCKCSSVVVANSHVRSTTTPSSQVSSTTTVAPIDAPLMQNILFHNLAKQVHLTNGNVCKAEDCYNQLSAQVSCPFMLTVQWLIIIIAVPDNHLDHKYDVVKPDMENLFVQCSGEELLWNHYSSDDIRM